MMDITERLLINPNAYVCIRREASAEIVALRQELAVINAKLDAMWEENTRLESDLASSCAGCHCAPAKEGDNYDLDCLGCRRFYADMYATKESEE